MALFRQSHERSKMPKLHVPSLGFSERKTRSTLMTGHRMCAILGYPIKSRGLNATRKMRNRRMDTQ
jgi:hypothetical protein